jgi:hypothetical protein
LVVPVLNRQPVGSHALHADNEGDRERSLMELIAPGLVLSLGDWLRATPRSSREAE